jgi:hypothetical protein
MRFLIAGFLFTSMLAAGPLVRAQDGFVLDQMVAVVEDDVILRSDVDAFVFNFMQQQQQQPAYSDELWHEALREMINQKVMLVHARRDTNLVVSDSQVEETLDDRINRLASQVGGQARLEEIFELINRELSVVKRDGMLPGGILLCGGGANLAGIADLAKQRLRLPAHIRSPRGFSGIVDKIQNPQFATAVGLMLVDMEVDSTTARFGVGSVLENPQGWISDILGKFRR